MLYCRLFFVVARNGHAPALLNTVHLTRRTPGASVIALVSVLYTVQNCTQIIVTVARAARPNDPRHAALRTLHILQFNRAWPVYWQGLLSAGALLLWSDVGPLLTSTSYLSNLHDTVTVSTLLYFRWRLSRSSARPASDSDTGTGSRSGANGIALDSQSKGKHQLPLAVPLLVLAFQFVVQLGAPLLASPQEPGTFSVCVCIFNLQIGSTLDNAFHCIE